MDPSYLLKGFILGFSIAAPVGPIGVLCIRRTLANGRLNGFISGLGAATADMFYGSVAAFGLTAIQSILIGEKIWLRWIGGAFLLFLGLRTFFTKPNDPTLKTKSEHTGLGRAYLSVVLLTLTNPATIISFTVIFAGLGFVRTNGNYVNAAVLVSGVFLGSAAWWLTLSSLIGVFREKFTPTWITWVNRLAGLVLMAFSLAAFLIL